MTKNYKTVFVNFSGKFCKICYNDTRVMRSARCFTRHRKGHPFQTALNRIERLSWTKPWHNRFFRYHHISSSACSCRKIEFKRDHTRALQHFSTNVNFSSSLTLFVCEIMQLAQTKLTFSYRTNLLLLQSVLKHWDHLIAYGGFDKTLENVKDNFINNLPTENSIK